MSKSDDNPYSPPSAAVSPADESPMVTKETESPWRFVWGILFFLSGSVFTLLAIYFTFGFAITWDVAPPDKYVLSIALPTLILAWIVGGAWLWSARSFWLANYRSGLGGAAVGFVCLVAAIVWLSRF